jgi:hypothetical protein
MAQFRISIDDTMEDLFEVLEVESEGSQSLYCDINAHNHKHAAEILCKRLIPFFEEKFVLYGM